MEFADYPGLNADLAADFHARHFARRDTHMFSSDHLGQMPHFNPAALAGLAVDVKPRLTKEQHDILESEFQKQAKPNTNTKKRFAEILGVSLDKVNNWFQNRRAKSKQDAKKQAGAFNLLQATQQQQQQNNFAAMNQISQMNGDNSYCMPSIYNGIRDSAINMDGLGISQAEQLSNTQFASMDQMTSQPMRHQASQQSLHSVQSSHSMNQDFSADSNRHTLTQAQFDAFSQAPFSEADSTNSVNATASNDFYPEFCDFSFDQPAIDPLASTPAQPSDSTDAFAPANTADDAKFNTMRNSSATSSDGSAPSVSITPAEDKDDFNMDLPGDDKTATSSAQWQPGQSVPVEITALRKEFQEASMRGRDFSIQSIPDANDFLDQPLAFPNDDAYTRRESSTTQLARSMQSFTMAPQRSAVPSSSIAARRQRPRPTPLGTGSLRSSSYCGALPTSPGPVGGNHNLGGHSLRRIKSSQTSLNGIAGGRIQKSVGSAQRSPSGYTTFADATNGGRFARRVSSFSPAYASLAASSASLAPPTPLSPTDVSRNFVNMQSQPMMRQTSMTESESDYMVSAGVNFSPPSTPMYANQFIRGRMGSLAVPTEYTPPQSAPPTQQCFPGGPPTQPHISTMPMMPSQAQAQGFVGMMPNEYPQMHNVMFPTQQQQQYMDTQMSYIMTNTGEVISGYPVMPPFAQAPMQQATPPNQHQPFVPSSSLSPSVLGSSQVPKQQAPAADFFVHEYSPPQDVKQTATPRKVADSGPKNYTFSNHGPEYFEKNAKHKGSSSPASSTCESAA